MSMTMRHVRIDLDRCGRVLRDACRRPRGGFSLIEVLIAVVVLALGLLGVGAVFPVVIRSQRQSQDVIQGQVAARAASAYVMGRQNMLSSLRELAYDMNVDNNVDDPPDYNASPWYIWANNAAAVGGIDPKTGGVLLPNPDKTVAATTIYIPMADRLFPSPFTQGLDPQYAWDIALRRKKSGGAQVVIFTRRIDSQIGVPTGWTLSHALTGHDLPAASARVPLATDGKSIPTGNGVGSYSRVRMLQLDRWGGDDKNERNASEITVKAINDGDPNWNDGSSALRRAEVIGQRLVDNMGNVYTVTGTREGKESASDGRPIQWLRLDPPLSRATWQEQKLGAKIEMLLTPQVPAAVSVIDVE